MTTRTAIASVVVALLGGCGTDPASGELVVADAPGATLLGASSSAVYWSSAAGTRVLGGSLETLPTTAEELAMATGPATHVADHVVFVADEYVMRVGVGAPVMRLASATVEALGETPEDPPRLVWSNADRLSWGQTSAERTVVIARTTRIDHVRSNARRIYAVAEGPGGGRLIYVDRTEGLVRGVTASTAFADSFPGGARDGVTYGGRIVGLNDERVYWLVEETAAGAAAPARAILVDLPERGEPAVLLQNIQNPSAFFVADDGFYWQEGDALLTAPLDGGAASIAAHLPGTAGALADGFVYFVNGSSIERLAL